MQLITNNQIQNIQVVLLCLIVLINLFPTAYPLRGNMGLELSFWQGSPWMIVMGNFESQTL